MVDVRPASHPELSVHISLSPRGLHTLMCTPSPSFVTPTAVQPDFVTNAEIYGNDIEHCGVYDFVFVQDDKHKNGEGICE